MVFPKGKSGNPRGRKKGSKDCRAIFKDILINDKKEMIAKAVEMAKKGNEPMLRLLLDKLLPSIPRSYNSLEKEKIKADTYHKDTSSEKLEVEIEMLDNAPEILAKMKEIVGV